MNVGEMQRKLSQWAEQDKGRKFYDLYDFLYDQDWLRLAHDDVKQNAGSMTAGCDGMNMSRFDENLESNLQQLTKELKSESFVPHPVRRVDIPKPHGKTRPLGIPSIKDRIVQEALRMVLEPIFEADFSPVLRKNNILAALDVTDPNRDNRQDRSSIPQREAVDDTSHAFHASPRTVHL